MINMGPIAHTENSFRSLPSRERRSRVNDGVYVPESFWELVGCDVRYSHDLKLIAKSYIFSREFGGLGATSSTSKCEGHVLWDK